MAERRRRRVEETVETDEELGTTKESPVIDLGDAYSDVQDRVREMFDIPEDFKLHFRAARREILLAVRSLIDARIASLDEAERKQGTRRGRVIVE